MMTKNTDKNYVKDVHLKKGDAFVNTEQLPPLFMEINEVEESKDYMDICLVTWYGLTETGPNIQKRFPMAARAGKIMGFEHISNKKMQEVKKALRQLAAEIKNHDHQQDIRVICNEYDVKLRMLIPGAVAQIEDKQKVEDAEVKTNLWIDCSEDNYWVEDNPELSDNYATVVCVALESYDDQNEATDIARNIYLHDNCPYSWGTLAKYGAKYMIIEKPEF